MSMSDTPHSEAAAREERLSRLIEAILRLNERLDLDGVLQEAVDSARSLTGARYGAITTLDESGPPEDLLTSGMSDEERRGLEEAHGGAQLFDHLRSQPEPLRVPDLTGHARPLGLPETVPLPVGALLTSPIRHRRETLGHVYLARDPDGGEFSPEDEDALVMFAAQAAPVIAKARRHREEQRARAGLETLIETSPVGVAVFDAATGAPLSVNREALRITDDLRLPGRPREDLLKVLTVRRGDGQVLSLAEFPFAKLLGNGERLRAEELVLSVPDGRSVTVLVNVTPLPSEDGGVETVVVTFQDMTPLEDLERLRADFLGMVSHELREPLTSIKGSTDTMLESLHSLDPAEIVQFLRIIKSQTERMRDLISQLLDVARIETGALAVSPEPADLASLVDEARNTFLSGGNRENLVIDLEPDLPRAMADRRRIVQVLGNLLTNAARYSGEDTPIRVSVALEDGSVSVSVADEGRGVEPERLPFLFRKPSAPTDGEGDRDVGSGLGLAICKGIVDAHGGRIWAESEGIGLGTRFTFTLPQAEEPGSPEDGAARSSPSSRWGGRERARVLAVDDDPMTLRYVRDALSKAGYTPLVTGDADEALRIVETDRPRLVLLDLVLPGSDGIELMKTILNVAEVPVIFLSAYGRDEIIARAFEAGAVDYMVKPFSSTELVARVRGALRQRVAFPPAVPSRPFALGDLRIDYAERRVSLAGRPVHLTPTEFDLLSDLSINAGRVVTFDDLLERVWDLEHSGGRGSVRTYVKRLRRKLDDDAESPRYLFAEPRVGYRMPRGDDQAGGKEPPDSAGQNG